MLDGLQPVFPPPKVNQIEKKEEGPQEMHPVDFIFLGVLDDASYSGEETGDSEAKNNREQNAHVQIHVHKSTWQESRLTVRDCGTNPRWTLERRVGLSPMTGIVVVGGSRSGAKR